MCPGLGTTDINFDLRLHPTRVIESDSIKGSGTETFADAVHIAATGWTMVSVDGCPEIRSERVHHGGTGNLGGALWDCNGSGKSRAAGHLAMGAMAVECDGRGDTA